MHESGECGIYCGFDYLVEKKHTHYTFSIMTDYEPSHVTVLRKTVQSQSRLQSRLTDAEIVCRERERERERYGDCFQWTHHRRCDCLNHADAMTILHLIARTTIARDSRPLLLFITYFIDILFIPDTRLTSTTIL